MTRLIDVAKSDYFELRAHVVPSSAEVEEAAFLFARPEGVGLVCVEWFPVPPEGFVHQSEYYIELTDEARASAIKRAHDLGSSLVEVHSHPRQREARFSPSDRSGFLEFVPHVLWRLRGRPYAAIVFTPTTFDALVWESDVHEPVALSIRVGGGQILEPTGATLPYWSSFDEQ